MSQTHETQEEIIIQKAIYYQSHTKEEETNTEGTKTDWYKLIQSHYQNQLLPIFSNNNEHFIEYFPAMFSWGESSRVLPTASDMLYQSLQGQYGTGYICFSDENIYISVFDELTTKYPVVSTRTTVGFFINMLMRSSGNTSDDRKPFRGDNTWVLKYSSLIGVLTGQEASGRIENLLIKTSMVVWKIYAHFTGTQKEIETIIHMGIEGKLSEFWKKPKGQKESDVFSTIKKLKELLDAGIITNSEFEQKKTELLRKI